MDLSNHATIVKRYRQLSSSDSSKTRRHDALFRFLEAAAPLTGRFKMLASPAVQNVLYDEYAHIAYNLNAFYNETVAFIVEGKKRRTSVQSWEALFNTYADDMRKLGENQMTSSLGASILNATFGVKNTVRNYGESHQSLEVSDTLLSYADHEVFELWISRDNGVMDLSSSLSIMLNFTHP